MSSHSPDKLKEVDVTELAVNSSSSSPRLSSTDERTLNISSPGSINLESQTSVSSTYHVFTRSRKLQMVCIVSLAAIFSPLSSNIYFPALGMISKVSLPVEILIFQGFPVLIQNRISMCRCL